MARALIVGCGCRGRSLGEALRERGVEVRGTTRGAQREAIEAAGLEMRIADPDRVGTVLDAIEDVSIVVWLMGTAVGEPEVVAAVHGPRLERLLESLVDTPVRGFVYEAAGRVQRVHLERGARVALEASERWRIPVSVVDVDPSEHDTWLKAMLGAVDELIS